MAQNLSTIIHHIARIFGCVPHKWGKWFLEEIESFFELLAHSFYFITSPISELIWLLYFALVVETIFSICIFQFFNTNDLYFCFKILWYVSEKIANTWYVWCQSLHSNDVKVYPYTCLGIVLTQPITPFSYQHEFRI